MTASFSFRRTVIALLLIAGCTSTKELDASKLRIIFFGDSITQMGNDPGGYVSLVRDSLRSFGPQYEVIGAGISGNKVSDLERRLQKDVLDKKPNIVVIYIGINDVWHYQFADRGLTGTPKDSFEIKLRGIVSAIQRSGAKVILCTPSVIGEKKEGGNSWDTMLDDYSAVSRKVAGDEAAGLLDLRNNFTLFLKEHNPKNLEKGILTTDGVHLNSEGNRFVADLMIQAISSTAGIPSR